MRNRRNGQAWALWAEPLEERLILSASLPSLQVDSTGRNLVTSSGQPFFWLADTAWELFHRLTRAEAQTYLRDRAARGFNVIQAVAIAELDGFNSANALGDQPLLNDNPLTPAVTPGDNPDDPVQYDHWDHIEYIIDSAESLGLYTALLPTWGKFVNAKLAKITLANAHAYGQFIGQRFANKPVIWVLGGDSQAWGYQDVWRAMARGIAIGATGTEDYSRLLMTYHAPDGDSGSLYFHSEAWMDFSMFQSGHSARNLPNYNLVTRDWTRTPAKPTFDSEPRYEGHPIGFSPAKGLFDDADVRQAAYWSVFTGAMGHTYGHHGIWQMHAPGRTPVWQTAKYWYGALHDPGGDDMRHLRSLMESFPQAGRIPDQALVADAYTGGDHVRATRGAGYGLIYTPTGQPLTVDLSRIDSAELQASWYDPRMGESTPIGTFTNQEPATFTPPTTGRGNDWVLVLAGPIGLVESAPEDTTAPTLTSIQWQLHGTLPQLELTFSEDIGASLTLEDLFLQNRSAPLSAAVAATDLVLSYDPGTFSATIRFAQSPLPADGLYELRLRRQSINDSSGNALESAPPFQFRVRIGDANADGRVDIDDYFAIDGGYAWGLGGFGHGDFNLDGTVSPDDYFLIDQAYFDFTGPDLIAPEIIGATFATDSMYSHIVLRFSEDVSAELSLDDFLIVNADTGRAVFPWGITPDEADGRTIVLVLPALRNGQYQLIINPDRVYDAGGNDLGSFAFDFQLDAAGEQDLDPPVVQQFTYASEPAPRLELMFSEAICGMLNSAEFWLFNQTARSSVDGLSFDIVYVDQNFAITLAPRIGFELSPGDYVLHLWADSLADLSGNAIGYHRFSFTVAPISAPE